MQIYNAFKRYLVGETLFGRYLLGVSTVLKALIWDVFIVCGFFFFLWKLKIKI